MESNVSSNLRHLPSIDALLRDCSDLQAQYGHAQCVRALRHVVEAARLAVQNGELAPPSSALIAQAVAQLARESVPTLRPVINASGVIIHTNLGRAPLSAEALAALHDIGGSYSTLEYDLEPGTRGKRDRHIERLLCDVTGAEAAMVVNNNASAVLLALTALAHQREAIISRGQLVEIGGAFRVPDVMAQSGAIMVEVGTTNRTHPHDFASAIKDNTAALVRAHASNFKVIGFTEETPLSEMAAIAHARDVLLLDDLGSGTLIDTAPFGLGHEPMVQESLAAGADLVMFSGDKLLGGPQAGLIVGRTSLIATLKRHPLARAIRADKLCLGAMYATLEHYRRGEALTRIPVWRMISAETETLRARAETWAKTIPGDIVASESTVGGGSLPGETLPTWAFAPHVDQPNAAAARLRQHTPPVIARVANDRLLLDPRTVFPEQDQHILAALHTLTES